MGAVLLWLKSKFLGNSLAWIFIAIIGIILLVIVLPNLDQIKEKLGFETRTSLKLQVVEQQKTIEAVTESNDNLQTNLVAKEAIEGINNQALEEQANALEAAHKQVEQTVSTKKAKIRTIKSAHKATATTTNAAAEKAKEAKEISQVQIDSIWETYCYYNACSAGASS